jgi:hypothetical protein
LCTYRISELNVYFQGKGETFIKQSRQYAHKSSGCLDLVINLQEEEIKNWQWQYPQLDANECEYMLSGGIFYTKLLEFDGFMLHSSAIAIDNKAYLFSAGSGTGKSTHTELWRKYLGEDRVRIINDDKPAIRLVEDKFYAYGTPWSGKSDKNLNIKIPLEGIIFIEQAQENWIEKPNSRQALKLLLEQTLRPQEIKNIDQLLTLLDKLLLGIPVYKMGCNISEEAVKLAYTTLVGNK